VRVLHVVTLLTPDGAFGGPVRVAENQTTALRARGHEVIVAAGQRGFPGGPPSDLGGTAAQLFPVRRLIPGTGFSGLSSWPMQRWLAREVRQVDVVHVHLARDLITLPAARLAQRLGVPYVLQPHGMIVESNHPLAGPLDAALTRRVLAGAHAVFYLTDEEAESLRAVGRQPILLRRLRNGTPPASCPLPPPERPEVLFCSRLHVRKRPVLFTQMARELLAKGLEATFALVGPDEGQGPAVAATISAMAEPARLRWEGSLPPSATLARMQRASLLVLPSLNEPNPMAVLEALSVGLPVVVTDSCGLAPAVRELGVGVVVDSSLESLVSAVRQLLQEPAALAAMALRAASAARDHFGMDEVADILEGVYASAMQRRGV